MRRDCSRDEWRLGMRAHTCLYQAPPVPLVPWCVMLLPDLPCDAVDCPPCKMPSMCTMSVWCVVLMTVCSQCLHAQASELHAQLHQRLTSTLRAALKKAQGKQRAFQQQLGAADGADEVQMQADMITANMWR